MKLTKVEVRNYRSIFEQTSTSRGLGLDFADGINVLVGRNNCGKSNLFRALALALDPAYEFGPEADIPGPLPHRYPSVQLRFDCDPNDPDEAALLAMARDYERLATDSEPTVADRNQLKLRVAYAPTEDGSFERRERLVFTDGSDEPQTPAARKMLPDVTAELRALVRFVLIRSGESIESVLEGNFREILHAVVAERMEAEFAAAEDHRQEYINGLQTELLGPLRDSVESTVQRLFPEIDGIEFSPDVRDIETTLARVEIGLRDAVLTPLAQKGTGVRGGVLVAMLRYLADHASRCVVFAVEEPEAFLHPAAQEELRKDLEALSTRPDVSVLVTSHSPFILSQEQDAMSVLLDKDNAGRTHVSATSHAGDQRVAVISGIVRQDSLTDVIDAMAPISEHKAGVLLVEGYGDKSYLELAAKVLGKPGLVSDLEIIPSNGCSRMVNLAAVARASTDLPIALLLDNDEPGRDAGKRVASLESHDTKQRLFGKKLIHTYADVFSSKSFEWEAEDLFDWETIKAFVDSVGGPYVAKGTVQRPDGGTHFDLDEAHKTQLGAFLEQNLTPDAVALWEQLLGNIRSSLGLPDEAVKRAEPQPSGTDSRHQTEPVNQQPATDADQRVLVVSQNYGHAEYTRSHVYVGESGRGLSPDIRYLAFYENGEIRPEIPKVLARHDDLVFDESLIERLTASTNSTDQKLAEYMSAELESGRRAPGDTRQVFLLTAPDDPETLSLTTPIKNTKLSPKGRPMAWVVRHKLTWKHALTSGATTTDELDTYEEAQTA